ncbi:hypothetical protein M9H77_00828 [Catharanthus roseus]|uniref:Uncharacterized protein n=1 Tax=Catharanthus roseus TaxID=4058 RepID=A0ACC0C488_CATRO|nr:hypothetical protein M9H77_00828 [Catharanthus roseus]
MRPRSRFSAQLDQNNPSLGVAASFGTFASTKMNIDAAIVGVVIGKNGANSKQVCRQTGVKLSIKDHESDPHQRNIVLEGTFDQIKEASIMLKDLILSVGGGSGHLRVPTGSFARAAAPSRQTKSKMCENFAKGSCSFGERCHFAHSAGELRRPPA